MMDHRVQKIKTPEECEIFARNAIKGGRLDLAQEARVRAIRLRAEAHGAKTDAEREALAAVYAYEEILTQRNGKRTKATRTWQMIKRHGVIEAVERAVNRPNVTLGYKSLLDVGLQDYAFEAIVLKYPSLFSEGAVQRCRERAAEWNKA